MFSPGADVTSTAEHWERVHATREPDEVSWHQETPQTSLDLIGRTGVKKDAAIVDIGGGASRLVDALLDLGHRDVRVVDIAASGLERARARLGNRARDIRWIVADVTKAELEPVHVWHDRALFHFLTSDKSRRAYTEVLLATVPRGGHAIFGTFALDGPDKCSGCPVRRYDATRLDETLGPSLVLEETFEEIHRTPNGRPQHFLFARFRRN